MRSALNLLIRSCVEEVGDPLMRHICKHTVIRGYTIAETKVETLAMVNRGELRMKDDDTDHDWTYRRGHNWDKAPNEEHPGLTGSTG